MLPEWDSWGFCTLVFSCPLSLWESRDGPSQPPGQLKFGGLSGLCYQTSAVSSPTGSFRGVSITGNFLWGSPYCTNKELLSTPTHPPPEPADAAKAEWADRGGREQEWGAGADSMGRNEREQRSPFTPFGLEFVRTLLTNWCMFTFTSWPDHTELGEKRPKKSERSTGQPPPLTSKFCLPKCATREDCDD